MSWFLTWGLRSYLLKKNILDIPNLRSSHSTPTPRGGGLAIVISFLGGIAFLAVVMQIDIHLAYALFGAGAMVAIIGYRDDCQHVAARWRLSIHLLAATWVVVWLGGFPLEIFTPVADQAWLIKIISLLFLVWLLNLYNFMDGIDGIVALETITLCIGMLVLYSLLAMPTQQLLPIAILLFAVVGFLLWNFPRAKIFLGDVGSGFLGIIVGTLFLSSASVMPGLFWSWLILLGVFIVDATLTLLRRLIRGEKVYMAHRSHAYQYAARRWGHIRVSLGVALINVLWLLPLAYLAAINAAYAVWLLILAYLPILLLAIIYKGGQPEDLDV